MRFKVQGLPRPARRRIRESRGSRPTSRPQSCPPTRPPKNADFDFQRLDGRFLVLIDSGLVGSTDFHCLGGVPREQKMLKGHIPRVKYHQLYS